MSALYLRVEVQPEPRQHKPRVVVVAAAMDRAPLVSDIDTMPPPRGAMLPYPIAPSIAAEAVAIARTALAMGGTVGMFTVAPNVAAAEQWLASLDGQHPVLPVVRR